VETFHVVSECKTAVYFSWSNSGVCPTNTAVLTFFTFGVESFDSLTNSDLKLLIETEQDGTRHSFIQ